MAHFMGKSDKLRVILWLEDGATASSVAATLDMFRLAHRFAPTAGFLPIPSSTLGGDIRLAESMTIATTPLPEAFSANDVIIVPGFFADAVEHIDRLLQTTWQEGMRRLALAPPSVLMAASCHGTFVLAQAGRLNGRVATTAWWHAHAFAQRYPDVRLDASQALVDSGPALTAGAMTAHTPLCLHLLRRLGGSALARQVGAIMLVDGARVLQQPFRTARQHFEDPWVQAVSDWLASRLDEPFSAVQLARAHHVSVRTMARRFAARAGFSPLEHLQALRIERAKALLADTTLDFGHITIQCGYADVSTFRRLFKSVSGLTPQQYRQQFRTVGSLP
jgi:transcriptional regulator GlxA family with amidase domain